MTFSHESEQSHPLLLNEIERPYREHFILARNDPAVVVNGEMVILTPSLFQLSLITEETTRLTRPNSTGAKSVNPYPDHNERIGKFGIRTIDVKIKEKILYAANPFGYSYELVTSRPEPGKVFLVVRSEISMHIFRTDPTLDYVKMLESNANQ